MQNNYRSHPHVNIPQSSTRYPQVANPTATDSYPYPFNAIAQSGGYVSHSWDGNTQSPTTAHPSHYANGLNVPQPPQHPRNRTRSVFEPPTEFLPFPEPQVYRSSSQRASPVPHYPIHRNTRSDGSPSGQIQTKDLPPTPINRTTSPTSSFYPSDDNDSNLSHQLSNIDLNSEDGLLRFQAGDLPDVDAEWHKFVPLEAREALGQKEVQRQSSLFEVIKAERDYVHDMELVEEVFIQPLKTASLPVIPPERLSEFISDVFLNLHDILSHHQRMLGALFARQREQHPLVQSVADIILDTCLLWRNAYESYIKHYPLAEARHRSELKRNPRYQAFIQQCSQNPRIQKRDIVTFLSRPVTRLPRLSLVLETIKKYTEPDHPDLDTLPLILTILSDFIKSTQPGIAAAESKVKFWGLCESLVFQKGEIIDMDLYDDSRTLVFSGTLARRQRSETDWHGWNDYFVALLDNFLVLTREETRSNGVVNRLVGSRPLPLEYLRLGEFSESSETRKVSADDGRLLESLRFRSKPLFPFTIYHAAAKSTRRYTLFAASEALRQKWKEALLDTIAIHKARQDANMWFVPQSVSDGFFRTVGPHGNYSSGARFSGKVTSAAPFSSGNRRFIAAGCSTGIFVAPRGDQRFQKVLSFSSPTTLIALQDFNKFIVQHDSSLYAYSLDLLARVAQGQAPVQSLDASMEKLAEHDGYVQFTRAGRVGDRTLLIYAAKKMLQTSVHALEAVNLSLLNNINPRRGPGGSLSFRPFGGPYYIPRDAYDVTSLIKTIAVSTEKGIIIIDPTNQQKSVVNVVPEFDDDKGTPSMADLKTRCEAARPLGILRCHATELLVVYDTIGCYITKYGIPSRSAGYIRWESKAASFAHRGNHVLLFSPEFIEVRNITTGRLVQVIEGIDLRLLHCEHKDDSDTILIAKKGGKDDKDGVSDQITELVETVEITTPSTTRVAENFWDEWDM